MTARRFCLGGGDPVQAGARAASTVRRARRPWPVLTEETVGMAGQGGLQ
jgi:hypothetical protein